MHPIDQVQLSFNPQTLVLLNMALGLVMFGVALDLRVADFQAALRTPKALAIGLVAHHLLFPAMTYGLISLLQPEPSIALGMLLVSACPAGHISNFLVNYAKGNTALSVSTSAVSTLLSMALTPLNFTFWGSLHPLTAGLMNTVALSPWSMFEVLFILLLLPLALGMGLAKQWPALASKMKKPIRKASFLILLGFIVGALAANFRHFVDFIGLVFVVVLVHNLLALCTGYGLSTLFGLSERDRRAITFETGIQNSGLGLILVFNFFDGMGGMAIVTAWWGIWHIVTGTALAAYWSRRPPIMRKTPPSPRHH